MMFMNKGRAIVFALPLLMVGTLAFAAAAEVIAPTFAPLDALALPQAPQSYTPEGIQDHLQSLANNAMAEILPANQPPGPEFVGPAVTLPIPMDPVDSAYVAGLLAALPPYLTGTGFGPWPDTISGTVTAGAAANAVLAANLFAQANSDMHTAFQTPSQHLGSLLIAENGGLDGLDLAGFRAIEGDFSFVSSALSSFPSTQTGFFGN